VMVVEGVSEEKDAFALYQKIIVDGLSVSMSKILGV